MKHMKKLAGLALALVMLIALAVPALADEDDNGKIIIDNAIPGATYTIYRIFDLESFNTETSAYSYKVNPDWQTFINGDGKSYVSISAEGYVTWVDGADVTAFAAAAKDYAETLGKNNGQETAADPANNSDGETSTVYFNDLSLGYYLVSSGAGALCSLDTTDTQVTIKEKNGEPTVDKEVEENSTGAWGDTNDANIGEVVNFRTTILRAAGHDSYVLHDKMSAGLTFDPNSVVVTIDGSTTPVTTDNYSVNTGNDDCTFDIVFNDDWLDTVSNGANIVVHYSATLNANAVVAGIGNPNETWLKYDNDSETEHDTTRTYTYEFDLVKTNAEDYLLEGAVFELYREGNAVDSEGNLDIFAAANLQGFADVRLDEDNNWYVYTIGVGGKTNNITVSDGKVIIKGLDAGTYYLKEITAPDGYNMLKEPIKIEISGTPDPTDGTVSVTLEVDGVNVGDTTAKIEETTVGNPAHYENGGVRVVNNNGTELPSTGGIGTTIFYVVGGVLIAAAAILLITKRRMSMNED